jgi:hypothetical protein
MKSGWKIDRKKDMQRGREWRRESVRERER